MGEVGDDSRKIDNMFVFLFFLKFHGYNQFTNLVFSACSHSVSEFIAGKGMELFWI